MDHVNKQKFAFSGFSFDGNTGELAKGATRLRIARQSAEILRVLLEHHGELVTREALRDALWPQDYLIDFEQIINNRISHLRYLLRDDPKQPEFIETIPKRGYRLIAPVELISEPEQSIQPPNADHAVSEVGKELTAPTMEVIVPQRGLDASHPSSTGSRRTRGHLLRGLTRRRWISVPLALGTVAMLAVITVFWYRDYKARSAQQIRMGIAPFESSDSASKQIADSFRMELSDALSELPQVQVRSSHSLSESSPVNATLRQQAEQLQLDTILFGRVESHDDKFTFRFELVRGSDAVHLSSFEYTGTRAELASIKDHVQRDIYTSLRLTNAGLPVHGGTSSPEAYDAYLTASAYARQQGDQAQAKAIDAFQTAVKIDPKFAKAYAGLATAQMTMVRHGMVPRLEGIAQAKQSAHRAIQLDPRSAEAHATLGMILYRDEWNAAEGESELRQAIAIEPNQALYHARLASLLCDRGQFDASLEEIGKAHANDPSWATVYMYKMYVEDGARLYQEEIATGRQLLQLGPRDPRAHDQLATALWDSGQYLDAIAEWRQMAVFEGDAARIDLEDRGRAAYLKDGVRGYARVRLDAILGGNSSSRHWTDFDPAEWYLAAGDKDKAMSALQNEVLHHGAEVMAFAVTPAYDGLHQDPRFRKMLAQLGLSLPTSYPKAGTLFAMKN